MRGKKKEQSLKQQILRFILSAGLGFLTDVVCFYILYHNFLEQKRYMVLGYSLKNSTISLAISFFFGVMVNFLMTRYIVFTESRSRFSKQFFRFMMVACVGFFANKLLLDAIISYFNLYPPVARVTAMLSLFFASFFIHKVFSFSLSLKQHVAADTSAGNNDR